MKTGKIYIDLTGFKNLSGLRLKNLGGLMWCVLLLALVQCKHPSQTDDFIGPEITPENFSVLDNHFKAVKSNVDFHTEAQSFEATFSNKVKWTIKIKGLESGAVKTVSGTSKIVDASISTWDGASDSVFFFSTGEKCVAEITFFNSTLSLKDTFQIKNETKYDGVLIDDFETYTADLVGLDSSFKDASDENITVDFANKTTKVQGKNSLLLSGLDKNANYWISGVNTLPNALTNRFTTTKSNELYFNISIYGTGDKLASLSVRLTEDDDNSGAFEAANDDAFTYLIAVDWKGWKRVSIPYSSFTDSDAALGNNSAEPSKLKGMSLALVANTSTQNVSLNADYIIFTNLKPLK
jgi:hypothetical protein